VDVGPTWIGQSVFDGTRATVSPDDISSPVPGISSFEDWFNPNERNG